MPKTASKYHALFQDPDIKRWHANLGHASSNTAEVYRKSLARFLAWTKAEGTPDFLACPQRNRDDLVSDYVAYLAKQRKAGSTIKTSKLAVVSWLDWNGLKLERRVKVPGAQERTLVQGYQIPSQDATRGVLNAADARSRAVIGLVAFAGLRLEVLGTGDGTQGLTFRDLPEAHLGAAGLEFDCIPTRINVPAALNKVRKAYFTFLGPEGCEYLAASVKERIQAGEQLAPDSPIVQPRRLRKSFMQTCNVSNIIRRPMRKAGIREPPYIFRSYFRNRCMMAQSKGLLSDWSEFFMGHKGTISAVYALHKTIPADSVEAMRNAYVEALSFLETRQTGERKDPILDFVSILLQARGKTPEEVTALNLAGKSKQEIVAILGDIEAASKQDKQRLVQPEELGSALGEGWTVRCQLSDGRIVLEAT